MADPYKAARKLRKKFKTQRKTALEKGDVTGANLAARHMRIHADKMRGLKGKPIKGKIPTRTTPETKKKVIPRTTVDINDPKQVALRKKNPFVRTFKTRGEAQHLWKGRWAGDKSGYVSGYWPERKIPIGAGKSITARRSDDVPRAYQVKQQQAWKWDPYTKTWSRR